eukprot:evm.model.scf_1815.2 EVM.evm.TU.scf_1815.2   scf_1815:28796-31892(+)
MAQRAWLGHGAPGACNRECRTTRPPVLVRTTAPAFTQWSRAPGHLTRPVQNCVSVAEPAVGVGVGVGDALANGYDRNYPDNHRGRRAGIVLHPTSLPGPYGVGEIGPEALRFVDWLESAGLQLWQVLPLVPPDQQYYSPYTGLDANCGNPLLISIDGLIEDGLLRDHEAPPRQPVGPADMREASDRKMPLLTIAARRLLHDEPFGTLKQDMEVFRRRNKWVEDSALFECLRNDPENEGLVWWEWPEDIRFRRPGALRDARKKYAEAIDEFVAIQFLFDKQWKAVKDYANTRGISIIGDMPIYVGGHSADVWANFNLFELSKSGAPATVSGVPPDAFSATGQLWGTPLYDWKAHKNEGYRWWAQRLGRALELFDETRIDHFRGFAGYWTVDAKEETAVVGVWKKGPGMELFNALKKQLGHVPIIAEDLGVITADVQEL